MLAVFCSSQPVLTTSPVLQVHWFQVRTALLDACLPFLDPFFTSQQLDPAICSMKPDKTLHRSDLRSGGHMLCGPCLLRVYTIHDYATTDACAGSMQHGTAIFQDYYDILHSADFRQPAMIECASYLEGVRKINVSGVSLSPISGSWPRYVHYED